MGLQLALIVLGTAATTALFLYAFAPAAPYLRLVDIPDQHRKLHSGRVPLTGGFSLFITLTVVFYVSGLTAVSLTSNTDFWPVITASLAVLVMMHAVDDVVALRAETRFAIDALLALLICLYAGVMLTTLGPLFGMGEVTLGRYSMLMTVFCFVAASNAFNMVDGIDSLCSGLGIVALATLIGLIAIVGVPEAHLVLSMLVVMIALAVAYVANMGLLGTRFRVFLGDSGARLIGFIIAISVIIASQHHLIRPVMAYFPIAIPVCDCLVLMATRLLRGRSPLSSDRLHLHHLLQDVGLSVPQARRSILGMALGFAAFGMVFAATDTPDWAMSIFVVVSFFAYMGFRYYLIRLATARMMDAAVSVDDDKDVEKVPQSPDTQSLNSAVS